MLDTALMYAISSDAGLRNRIGAVVMGVRWNGTGTGAVLTAPVPVDALAWAVATNPTIFATVKAALAERVEVLTAALAEHLPEAVYQAPEGGYFMWVTLPEDADVEQGMISTASPIGRALLNKEDGDEAIVTSPSGSRTFEVVKLQTIHDEA